MNKNLALKILLFIVIFLTYYCSDKSYKKAIKEIKNEDIDIINFMNSIEKRIIILLIIIIIQNMVVVWND